MDNSPEYRSSRLSVSTQNQSEIDSFDSFALLVCVLEFQASYWDIVAR